MGAENSPRYSVQDVEDSPKGRSAALSGELGGAERSAELRGEVSQRRRCPHSVCGGRGAVGGSSTALPACGREHHPVYSTPCRRAAVSITRSTALPACGREHHSIVDSTPGGSRPSSTALPACRPITGLYIPLFSPLSFRTRLNDERWQNDHPPRLAFPIYEASSLLPKD